MFVRIAQLSRVARDGTALAVHPLMRVRGWWNLTAFLFPFLSLCVLGCSGEPLEVDVDRSAIVASGGCSECPVNAADASCDVPAQSAEDVRCDGPWKVTPYNACPYTGEECGCKTYTSRRDPSCGRVDPKPTYPTTTVIAGYWKETCLVEGAGSRELRTQL